MLNQLKAPSEIKDKEEKMISWKVLIVDDEADIHQVTKLAFYGFKFENRPIEFFSAYSSAQAEKLISENPDIAVILLDVVMEEEQSGLNFVKFLREIIRNKLARIIIRTGQPGSAPERRVIIEYDINDYREKTELSREKLYTTMIVALRSFRDLHALEDNKNKLLELNQAANHFVPHAFLNFLKRENIAQINLGDCIEQEMIVLYMDIRSFTSAAEALTPKESFDLLNDLLSYIEPPIVEAQGFIDKHIGDAVMALFLGSSDLVLTAATNILKRLKEFNKSHSQKLDIGISINKGLVVLGTIGLNDRMDCTAISDAVNTVAKLEKMNALLGTHLLITDSVFNTLHDKNKFNIRHLGKNIKIIGKRKLLSVYEVYSVDDESQIALKKQSADLFDQAIRAYDSANYQRATDDFNKVLAININDKTARYFLNICKILNEKNEAK